MPSSQRPIGLACPRSISYDEMQFRYHSSSSRFYSNLLLTCRLRLVHDRRDIAGGGPRFATGRVLRRGGRSPTLRPRGHHIAGGAAVVEPADPPAGATA